MNDDTLTLYYYDDGLTVAQRREVEAALKSDAELAERYRELCAQLDGLADIESPAAPPHLVSRWHDAIDQVAERQVITALRPRQSFHFGSFFWGAVVAASLALGIAIGVYVSGDFVPVDTVVEAVDSPASDAPLAFSRGLLVHFRESRDRLSVLDASANGERDQLIMNIIQQNRLFERMARQNESQDLARVLRAFEPILVQLVADDVSAEDAAKLQAQLAFEMHIVLTKLAREVSDKTDAVDT